MVGSWVYSIHIFSDPGPIGLFDFSYYFMPASIIVTIIFLYLACSILIIFLKNKKPSSRSIIIISSMLLVAGIVFAIPFLPFSGKTDEEKVDKICSIALESISNKDLSYNLSVPNTFTCKEQVGTVNYVLVESEYNYDDRYEDFYDENNDKVALFSSFMQVENVPSFFHDYERSLLLAMYRSKKLENNYDKEQTIKNNNSSFKYQMFVGTINSKGDSSSLKGKWMKTIIIFAESGDGFLIYQFEIWNIDNQYEVDENKVLHNVQDYSGQSY